MFDPARDNQQPESTPPSNPTVAFKQSMQGSNPSPAPNQDHETPVFINRSGTFVPGAPPPPAQEPEAAGLTQAKNQATPQTAYTAPPPPSDVPPKPETAPFTPQTEPQPADPNPIGQPAAPEQPGFQNQNQTEQPNIAEPNLEQPDQKQSNSSQQNPSRFDNVPPDEYQDEYYDNYYPPYMPPPPIQEELIYEWEAPSRPFKPHKRQYYTTVGTIVLLISLILFFAGQFLPIAVVIAVAFLTYVMTSIPPGNVTNTTTTFGIRIGDQLYFWEELGRFWFKKKYDEEVLYIEAFRFPNRLTLLLGKADKALIRDILSLALLEGEPAPTYYERAADWLQKKIPLDLDA